MFDQRYVTKEKEGLVFTTNRKEMNQRATIDRCDRQIKDKGLKRFWKSLTDRKQEKLKEYIKFLFHW